MNGAGTQRYPDCLQEFGFRLESMAIHGLGVYAQASNASLYHYQDSVWTG